MLLKNEKMAVMMTAIGGLVSITADIAAAQGSGFYAKEQAARGSGQYTAHCAQCHGNNLQGAEAPALIGKDVMGTWVTAQGLFDYMSVAMPPSAPGQLGDETYIDIISHILAVNGAPVGSKPLVTAELESVDLIKAIAAAAPGGPATAAAPGAPAPTAPRLPQAFTAGRTLPTAGAPAAAPAPENTAPRPPQAFTSGRTLPTVAPTGAAPELPGPGAR